jgi:hypothetical protein
VDKSYADKLNYWKSGRGSAESWVDKAKAEIRRAGGLVHGSAFVEEEINGTGAYCLAFELHRDRFQVKWPILRPRKQQDMPAAKRQAATMLYHDVKAACVKAKVFGARVAFLAHLQLANGRTAGELTNPELVASLPKMLTGTIGKASKEEINHG